MKDDLKCPLCGGNMTIYMDTPLCVKCEDNVLFELSFVKDDMRRQRGEI